MILTGDRLFHQLLNYNVLLLKHWVEVRDNAGLVYIDFHCPCRFLARVVVWLTVIVMVVGSVAGTAYLWVTWNFFNKKAQDAKNSETGDSAMADYWELQARNLLIGAIVATIFTVSLLSCSSFFMLRVFPFVLSACSTSKKGAKE